jgi:hypothetical protein
MAKHRHDWLEAARETGGEGAPRKSSKAPRNRDQELPRRQGDSIEPAVGSDRGQDRERNSPSPEDETSERDPVHQRPRS